MQLKSDFGELKQSLVKLFPDVADTQALMTFNPVIWGQIHDIEGCLAVLSVPLESMFDTATKRIPFYKLADFFRLVQLRGMTYKLNTNPGKPMADETKCILDSKQDSFSIHPPNYQFASADSYSVVQKTNIG